jgi:uroporphyrinogen-III decarboxylase
MRSKQRILAALLHENLDCIPVVPHGYSELFLRRYFDPEYDQASQNRTPIYNPNLNLVTAQLDAHKRFGFDPIIWMTLRPPPCDWGTWADDWVLHDWQESASKTWIVSKQLIESDGENMTYRYIIETPQYPLHCAIRIEPGHTRWILENLIKNEEDINLLINRPNPSQLSIIQSVNQQLEFIREEGVGIIHIPGVWHQACDLRGIEKLLYDIYDRPKWVSKFFELLCDYLVEVVKVLSKSKLEVLILNESHLGLGISPSTFERFVFQNDRRIIDAASSKGLLTIFHNCGRSNALLEGMARTGASAIETLAPQIIGGDVELSNAKRRVGRTVCLRGGMDTNVLENGILNEIDEEIDRCLRAGANGGNYILGPASPIQDAPFENLEYFAAQVKKISPKFL